MSGVRESQASGSLQVSGALETGTLEPKSDPLRDFREVWLCDFEFRGANGEQPEPHCMVAREFRTGRKLRLWVDQLHRSRPPFSVGPDALFVAYFASAEFGCFLALDWPMPVRVLDLFCEFRCQTNGQQLPCGNGLLGALSYHGLASVDAAGKDEMRGLAIRGGPFTDSERAALLEYCETDVTALARLLPAMLPQIDLPRAILRGRSMAAVARMEWNGTPIDATTLGTLRVHWKTIQSELIRRVDADYGVYDGTTFKRDRFVRWLVANNIPWPRLGSGSLALGDDTFRTMAKSYPAVSPLRELRHTLGELRLESLAVGRDGRNRTLLSPFRSKTGRNQPSNSRFIFGPSCWLRGLIKPESGRALAYCDWSQQKFGIAAALSGDSAMMDAYSSLDPYLEFAKQAGAVPPDATKKTHAAERERFKICALAVQYGMGEQSLAVALGQPPIVGRELLKTHRTTYATFWQWSQAAVDQAMLGGTLETVFGWRIIVGQNVNPRSLANFPMQANGAEMLRLACCLATERGIAVCAPVHDAVLVEGTAGAIDDVVAETQNAMREAAEIVLAGFPLRSDAKIVRYPERYMDDRGEAIWGTVHAIVADLDGRNSTQAIGVQDHQNPQRFAAPIGSKPAAERGTYLQRTTTPT